MQARLSAAAAAGQVGRRMTPAAALAIIGVLGWMATPLGAQYTSPGSLTQEAGIPVRDSIDDHVENSAWRLGAIRLSPWIGLRDASLVSTTSNAQASTNDDFTLTVGAGLRGYLPAGKVIWAAHLLPEYVWWQDNEAKRNLNGRYGLGLFGYFNRMSLELSHRRYRQQSFFSNEIQELTSSQTEISKLYVEVEASSRLRVFGIAEQRRYSNGESENAAFSLLDRDENHYAIGVRYRSARDWYVGLGYEDASVDFDRAARNLSNSGSGPTLDVGYAGSRVSLRLALAARKLEAGAGSDFGTFDDQTGSLEVLWSSSSRLGLLGYLRREQEYSVGLDNSYIVNDRQGARLDYRLSRVALSFSAEVGDDDYAASSGLGSRVDDVTALGARFRYDFRDRVGFSFQVVHTQYDSNLAGFDREVTNFGVAVELGALIEKLELGRAEGDW